MDEGEVDAIERLMESGRYEHALARLRPDIHEKSGSIQAWWLAARCLGSLKHYRQVIKYCDLILESDHDHRDALLLKGFAQLEEGLCAEALQTAKSALPHVETLSLEGRWPWLTLLGAAEHRNGAYVEAAETLESSLQSWAFGAMIMLLLKPPEPAPADWHELSDASPCVRYALFSLYLWPPGQYCEATDAFREISEFSLPDEEESPIADGGLQYFHDEVLNEKEVRRIVSRRYIEAFRAKCRADDFYREILAYRAKALVALGHEDADACCEEVRWLDPKLLEEE